MVGRKSWFFVWNAYVKSDTPSEFRDGISYGKKLESRNHEKKKNDGRRTTRGERRLATWFSDVRRVHERQQMSS